LFVKNGYIPLEAIVAATQIGTGVSVAADKLGTMEEGKLADLLVIDGDPLEDIRTRSDPGGPPT
jgi:imidazolonepropionase-like amidohydrolase